MDAARWASVRSILEAALDAPAEARLDVARSLAGSPEELAEVTALLSVESSGDFSAVEPASIAGRPPGARASVEELLEAYESSRLVGASFDGLTLTRLIGAGGMGEVFEAVRASSDTGDGPSDQRVAVKLIRRGMMTPGARRRFAAERAALSRLSHPNIAALLGGGEALGRPYIVLELVDGAPLLDDCTQRSLSVRERVALLRAACAGVAHAHQNLVVHRDLKPSNILVADGVPKLLDFGVAKLLGADEHGPTVTRLLTPGYASPEQMRGEPVTTASDVYSLGLILYDTLLAGSNVTAPGQSTGQSTGQTTGQATAGPTSHGTRPRIGDDLAPPSRLAPGIDRELDAIVAQALAADPARRYPSAEAMGADLERYLAGEPVRAMAASRTYRARKWVSRHRVGVGIAAAAGLVLTGAAIVASATAVRLQAERERTLAARRDADRVSTILGDLVVGAGQSALDGSLSMGALLDEAAARLERDAAGAPAVSGPVHASLASAYHAMGLRERALRHFRAGLDDHLAAFGDADPRTWDVREAYARALTLDGDFGPSERLWHESLAARALHQGRDHPDLARPHFGLGYARMIQGDLAAAGESFRTALRLAPPQGSPAAVEALIALGAVCAYDGRGEEGVEHRRRAVEMSREVHGPDSMQTSDAIGALGELLTSTGRAAEATPMLIEGVEIARNSRGPARAAASRALRALAWSYAESDRPDEAERVYREAARDLEAALPASRHDLVYLRENLARFLVRRGRDAEARPLFVDAAEAYREMLGPEHLRTLSAQAEVSAIDARFEARRDGL